MDINKQLLPEAEDLEKLKLDLFTKSNLIFTEKIKELYKKYQEIKIDYADDIYIGKVKVKDGMTLKARIHYLLLGDTYIVDEIGENPALLLTDIYDFTYIEDKANRENSAIRQRRNESRAKLSALQEEIRQDIYDRPINKMVINDKIEALKMMRL